jgi:hypothetical protein
MKRCKYYETCYFPKDVAKGRHGKAGVERYIESCSFLGLECEIAKLSKLEFKIFERTGENSQVI